MDPTPILEIEDLAVEYHTGQRPLRAVDRVDLTLNRGEILGLVGESGCGKTTLGHAMLRLIEKPHRVSSGRIRFVGLGEVLQMNKAALRHYRWEHIAYVFQSAQNALNPLLTIRQQARLVIDSHPGGKYHHVDERMGELLRLVNLDPLRVLSAYPHELSGGMKQRVGIALALVLDPEVIVLDEPTTALDVVSQATILEILRDIHQRLNTAMVFITHDMSVVAELADRVAVMYAGRIVEVGSVDDVFYEARHPYTQALMAAVPSLEGDPRALRAISGHPPDLRHLASGCRFQDRCPFVVEVCRVREPVLNAVGVDHQAACHRVDELPIEEVSR